ncbi:aminoglycoside N3'-acetyltransferase [Longilinea arvoryzae]|uniref:Aminoglycoside N(3)-acetyltransferase n=1 Tax=Longilinea arvoryzae TaxID=360412 RepID=A0A0S7BEX4_9CHLR|nr:AAC(3) family N-acetyltransferase [Longilinea arvoryzae]GAP12562.1 aminoglycoside N3'-acetyltransferase [Longilinea arvoryzae]
MLSYRDLVSGLKQINLDAHTPVIAHASLSAFGEIRGGADALLGALLSQVGGLMMPTFTYTTMITPQEGPAENGMAYGSGEDQNRMAEFYSPDMPADRLMGVTAEMLRRHTQARRSTHPILSFSGLNVDDALEAQTLAEPLAPIEALADQGGWVVLLGVDHTCNTSLHVAEKRAGRTQFIRWALTQEGVRACPGFPGCSNGFEAIQPLLSGITRSVTIGSAEVRAIPLVPMLDIAAGWIREDPLALLCSSPDCERCQTIRTITAPTP